jgi:hypothetical protein
MSGAILHKSYARMPSFNSPVLSCFVCVLPGASVRHVSLPPCTRLPDFVSDGRGEPSFGVTLFLNFYAGCPHASDSVASINRGPDRHRVA